MLSQYLPILIFLGLATVLGLALFTLGWVAGPRRPDPEKLSPTNAASRRSRIRACASTCATTWSPSSSSCSTWNRLLLPLGRSLNVTGTFGLVAMLIFALVLVVALVYDYKKGPWNGTRGRPPSGTVRGFEVTTVDKLINWARTGSLADDLWSRLLCGGDDARRRGALRPRPLRRRFRPSPRQSDVMIVPAPW